MQPTYILQPLSSSAAAVAEIQVPAAGRLTVGRESTNDVALPHDLRMSSAHFELNAEPGGCRVRDLRSTNGLFLNTKRVASALLVEGDELQAGDSCWRVVVRNAPLAPSMSAIEADYASSVGTTRPPSSYSSIRSPSGLRGSGVNAGSELPADLQLTTNSGVTRRVNSAQVVTIGRTALADWVFEHDGQMSSLHAEIFQYAGTWRVKDLDSSNGTYLNEVRISEGRLSPGDELRCGQMRFVVSLLPPQPPQATDRHISSGSASGPTAAKLASPLPPPKIPCLQSSLGEIPAAKTLPGSGAAVATACVRRISDGREFELPRGKTVDLGRGLGLPISLPDDLEVSTHHARLLFDGRQIQLQDMGSSNGTFVAGKRVTTCQLVDGQRFRVGQTDFLICTAPTCTEPDAASSILESARGDTNRRHAAAGPPTAEDVRRTGQTPSAPFIPTRHFEPSSTSRRTHGSTPADDMPSRPAPQHTVEPQHLAPQSPQGAIPFAEPTYVEQPAELQARERPMAQQPPPDELADEPANEPFADEHLQPAERPGENEPPVTHWAEAIQWDDLTPFAKHTDELRAVTCRSGLVVYRGLSSGLDPVDVGLRVLQSTDGWVLNGGDIENWMEAARQGLKGLPREWLNPAQADDASWMLPFLSVWGSGKAWLVFSSVDLDEVLQNILSLRPISDDAPPLMPALTPLALAAFLSEGDPQAIARFFRPVDALLVEVRAGESWALFTRPNLPLNLQQL